MELTKRQKDILYAIITEFIESAQPVGSGLISEKYEIDASPATIRYEMVRLSDEGFIEKEHSSSGRVPTILGYRYYIRDLMDEEDVNYLTEIRMHRELSNVKFQRDKLIRGVTTLLSDITKYAAVILTQDGIFYSGIYNLLDYPEFAERNIFKNILIAFDDISTMMNIFSRGYTDNRVKVLIGEETDEPILKDCSIVFTEVNLYKGERAIVAIVGPRRLNYSTVLPIMRTVADVVDRLTMGW